MKYYDLNGTGMKISQIGLGTMRLPELTQLQAEKFILEAIESGINFIDEADVYGNGKSEEMLGKIFSNNPKLRNEVILQSKAGIIMDREHRYDFSREHLVKAVKDSLQRLHTDYLDILLLHRPDALMNPKEVAEALNELHDSGLVHYFGVSNQTAGQVELLKKHFKRPLLINQLQLSIVHSTMIDRGIFQNTMESESIDRDGDILNYCMLNDILIQAWSPVQASWIDGTFINNPKYEALNVLLEKLSEKYHTNKSAIAIAWILKHPAKMQPILGTTSIQHLKESAEAIHFTLTNQEWYDLYTAEGKMIP